MGYAKHIGRVGALALALGIGTAVITPPIASAEEGAGTSAAEGTVADVSTPSEPAAPAPETDAETNTVVATDPPEVVDAAVEEPDDTTTVSVGKAPEAVISAQTNTGGTSPEAEEPDTDHAVQEPPDVPVPVALPETATARGPQPTAAAEADDPPAAPKARVNALSIESISVAAMPVSAAPTQPTVVTHTTVTATVDPLTALITLPANLITFSLNVIGAALAPFVAPGLFPGPAAPADTPILWAVLAFVRRQFFNASPTMNPSGEQTTTGLIVGDLGVDDADGDPFHIDVIAGPAHGDVEIDVETGAFTYTPDAGYLGTDEFTVTVDDGGYPHVHGLTSLFTGDSGHSRTTTVRLNITDSVNVAQPDTYAVDEDGTLTVAASAGVLANDTGGSPLTATVLTGPAHGTLQFNADGSFTYTPDANYFGDDTFRYSVTDGALSDIAVATIAVAPVNDPPQVLGLSVSVDENGIVTGNVFENGVDVDGDDLRVTAPGTYSLDFGELTIDEDGSFTYTAGPTAGDDIHVFSLSDGTTTTSSYLAVTVGDPNYPPEALPDYVDIAEDSDPVVIDVLANDIDPDGDTLTARIIDPPIFGSAAVNVDGTITYTPAPDFTGVVVFQYEASDGILTSIGTVQVAMSALPDAPAAGTGTLTVPEDSPGVAIDVVTLSSDPDGDSVAVNAVVTPPQHGSVTVVGDTIVYTPDPNFAGEDSFAYTVVDSTGLVSAAATVTVTVTPTNDAPTAVGDAVTVGHDRSTSISAADLLTNDTDIDNPAVDLSITRVFGAVNGSVTLSGQTVTVTPARGHIGPASFQYEVTDGDALSVATVTVEVEFQNRDPEPRPDAYSTAEDTSLVVNTVPNGLLFNDFDADDQSLTVTSTGTRTTSAGGTVTIDVNGFFTYAPKADFHGIDTFTYTVTDGFGGTATALVTVTVSSVTDVPTATPDEYTTDEDTPLVVDAVADGVLGNDAHGDGLALSVQNPGTIITTRGGTAVLDPDGTFTYTPPAEFAGPDSFSYTVVDAAGATAVGTVSIDVAFVNDDPAPTPDAYTTTEDTSLVVNTVPNGLLFNDFDADDQSLTVTSTGTRTTSAGGTVTMDVNGFFTYAPKADFHGIDTFTYTVTDGFGGTATALVTITVVGTPDNPVARPDTLTIDEDTTLRLTVPFAALLANDVDPDGDSLTVFGASDFANGTMTLEGATLVFTPTADFAGTAGFTYRIHDGTGGIAEARVTVVVTPVPDAPEASPDVYTTDEDTPLIVPAAPNGLLGNDSDGDEDLLRISGYTEPANGTLSLETSGRFSYTPDPNFHGADTFSYTVTDGWGTPDATTTVTINVTSVPDTPIANPDAFTIVKNTTLTLPFPLSALLANDTDGDGDSLTVFTAFNFVNGAVTLVGGALVFTPTADFVGAAGFDYGVSDGTGEFATGSVVVTVRDVDDVAGPNT